jgi:hypothetical protein
MKKFVSIVLCTLMLSSIPMLGSGNQAFAAENDNLSWTDAVEQSMALFDDGGGYYTGTKHPEGFTQNTWEGMDLAFQLGTSDQKPVIDVSKARPSFCSSACYMLLLRSLLTWDSGRNTISQNAWVNLKPYTLDETDSLGNIITPRENDGYGCWGRANANGPGLGVLTAELGAGTNYYVGNRTEYSNINQYYQAWDQAKPFDFLKIFWNSGIGCDDKNSDGDERGHMVLFLKKIPSWNADGSRDDVIYYWSSNGSKTDINAGYGISKCRESKIYRAVLTRITHPEKFNQASQIKRDNVNSWLDSLNGKKHGTVAELKQNCKIGGSLRVDTTSYTMAPGSHYEIGSTVTAGEGKALKVTSTNSKAVRLNRLANGNWNVTALSSGTAFIMYDLYDGSQKIAHTSVRITVQAKAKSHGDSKNQTALF